MGDTQERDLVERLRSALDDFERDIEDAYEVGERPDLWDEVVEVRVDDVKNIIERLSRERETGADQSAEISRLRSELADHEEVHASRRKLVRELDVILNGEEGAAPQASLCDVVDQVRELRSELEKARTWQPIETAPSTRPIIAKTAAGRIVKVKWVRLDDDNAGWGTPEEDDPCPNCWDDGFCWASNSAEEPSDPPVSWMEIPLASSLPVPEQKD